MSDDLPESVRGLLRPEMLASGGTSIAERAFLRLRGDSRPQALLEFTKPIKGRVLVRVVCADCNSLLSVVVSAHPDAPLLVGNRWRPNPDDPDEPRRLRIAHEHGEHPEHLWAPQLLLLDGNGPDDLWMPCHTCSEWSMGVTRAHIEQVVRDVVVRDVKRGRRVALRSGVLLR